MKPDLTHKMLLSYIYTNKILQSTRMMFMMIMMENENQSRNVRCAFVLMFNITPKAKRERNPMNLVSIHKTIINNIEIYKQLFTIQYACDRSPSNVHFKIK